MQAHYQMHYLDLFNIILAFLRADIMTLFNFLLLSHFPQSIEGVLVGKGVTFVPVYTKFELFWMQERLNVIILLFQKSSIRGSLALQTKTCRFLEHGLHFYAFYKYL